MNNTQITSRLNEKFFNDLLFISDSIIGITDDCSINNVIREIAKCLANTYRFNRADTTIDSPEHIKSLDINSSKYSDQYEYPLLFRSAVGYGTVYTCRDEHEKLYNITGKDFSDVVKLSENGKGSRLYINENLYDKLDESIKLHIDRDEEEKKMHYLWPIELIINVPNKNNSYDICNSFDCLLSTMELLCLYYDKVREKYLDLFDSFMKSYRIYNLEVGNKLDIALNDMIWKLKRCIEITKYKKMKSKEFEELFIERAKRIII